MIKIEKTIKIKREEIRRIAEQHAATNIRLFGSVARGEAQPDSDVDLLVVVTAQTSSWFPVGLILDLESCVEISRKEP